MAEPHLIDAEQTLKDAGAYQLRIADLDEQIVAEKEKLKDLKEEREENVTGLLTLIEEARTGQGHLFNRKPAAAAEPTTKKRAKAPRKSPWENLTPEERNERVKKMLASRGLKRPAKTASK